MTLKRSDENRVIGFGQYWQRLFASNKYGTIFAWCSQNLLQNLINNVTNTTFIQFCINLHILATIWRLECVLGWREARGGIRFII